MTLALLFAGACDSGKEGSEAQLPPVAVNLPPSPNFSKPPVPFKYPDGAVSVFGLKKKPDESISKTIRVKAFIVEVYLCEPPKCPKGQKCKQCDQPHFYVADSKDPQSRYRLLVTGNPPEKRKDLEVGDEVTITGDFLREDPNGFKSSEGLLVFKEMTGPKGTMTLPQPGEKPAKR
jgi:hypothetical protein